MTLSSPSSTRAESVSLELMLWRRECHRQEVWERTTLASLCSVSSLPSLTLLLLWPWLFLIKSPFIKGLIPRLILLLGDSMRFLGLWVCLERASGTPFHYLSFSPSFPALSHLSSSFVLPGCKVRVLFSFFLHNWCDVPSDHPMLKGQLVMDWHLHH